MFDVFGLMLQIENLKSVTHKNKQLVAMCK